MEQISSKNDSLLNNVIIGDKSVSLTEEEQNEIRILRAEERKIKERIKNHNARLLEKNIDKVAYAFAFLGLKAKINYDNKCVLDLLDSNNKLVHSVNFEESIGLSMDSKEKIICDNEMYNGAIISYFLTGGINNRQIISFDEPGGKHDGIRIEFFYGDDNTLENIDIRASYSNDPFRLVQFEINDSSIHAMINNEFGPCGNYVDGEHREIKLSDSNYKHGAFFYMTEAQHPDERGESLHSIYGSYDGFDFDLENVTGELSYKKFDSIAYNLTRHPRNKETIETVVNYFDSKIPGFKKYIQDNFIMYDYIMDNDYVSSPEMDEHMDGMLLDACNIENIQNKANKRETK